MIELIRIYMRVEKMIEQQVRMYMVVVAMLLLAIIGQFAALFMLLK
jgi:hypothetical protein